MSPFPAAGSGAESWRVRLEKLSTGRLFGRFFAASRERLREVAGRLDVRRVANLTGCPARSFDLELRIATSTQSAVPTFPARKPSARFADHFSLNSTRAAWSYSGSPSRPAVFALAGTSRSFNAGLLRCLELDVSSQLSVR